jgi:hypothetical protein
MLTANTKTSMLAVVGPAPLCTTVQAGANYTRQHANLLVSGQIVSGLVDGAVFVLILNNFWNTIFSSRPLT